MYLPIKQLKICRILGYRNIVGDVKTADVNNYIDNLMRNLNSGNDLRVIYKCDIRYCNHLSNLNTQLLLRHQTQVNLFFQRLKPFLLFDYSRYKINFYIT